MKPSLLKVLLNRMSDQSWITPNRAVWSHFGTSVPCERLNWGSLNVARDLCWIKQPDSFTYLCFFNTSFLYLQWFSDETHTYTQRLTEVEDHAGEDDESEPGAEVGDEVDDGDDDVTDGGKDTEQDVAKRRTQSATSWVTCRKQNGKSGSCEAACACPTSAGC